jgi:hypothetical protein
VAGTERSVLWNVDIGERRLVIDVHFGENVLLETSWASAVAPRRRVLCARRLLSDALVRAFDKDLRMRCSGGLH